MSSIHPKTVKKHPLLSVCIVVTQYNPKMSESTLHVRDWILEDLQEKLGSQVDIELYLHSVSLGYFHGHSYESHAAGNLVPPSTTLSAQACPEAS